MPTCTQTSQLAKRLGIDRALEIIKDAGYDAYDFSMGCMIYEENCIFNGPDYLKEAKRIRKVADALGIPCHQAHAPFHSSLPDTPENKEYNATIFGKIVRSMEIAATLGARYVVVHPVQHLDFLSNMEKLKEMNLEFYHSLQPYAEKFGIKVAVENMWQRNPIGGHIVDSVCARPEDFVEMIDALDPRFFVACLDVGHAVLCSHDPAEVVRALGHDRLHSLHVHDVDGIDDLHTMPFLAKTDWQSFADALREIRYDGHITLEADGFLKGMPDEILPVAAKLMARTARYLADQCEN